MTGVDAVGTAAQVIVPLPSNQANGDVGNVVYELTIALTGVGQQVQPEQFLVGRLLLLSLGILLEVMWAIL